MDAIPRSYLDDAVRLTRTLIANGCVNTGDPASGNEIVSVRSIQEYLGHEGTVVEPIPGRASVVYRLRGADPAAPKLLLIPHLDVVPASRSDWNHDPFAGDIADGFIWGRGAVDMLNVTAAMVALFKALADGASARRSETSSLRPSPMKKQAAAMGQSTSSTITGTSSLATWC